MSASLAVSSSTRALLFENGGEPEYFIGSADVMKRNLDERIEVLAPVRAPEHRRQLDELVEGMLADSRQGGSSRRTWQRDPSVTEPGTHAILLAQAPFA